MENNKIHICKTKNIKDIISVESTLEHSILSLDSINQDITNDIYTYSVIEYNDNIAGYIAFSNCIDHTDLISIAINPKYRGLGLAKELINYMEIVCKNASLFPIILEVRSSNVAAISLYEKIGFKLINTRKNYYKNPLEDALIYQKTSPTN